MKKTRIISCPISVEKVDGNVVRLIALMAIVVALCALYFQNYYLALLLSADFAVRAFTSSNISPLKKIAKYIIRFLPITAKPENAAPKKFAALLGFVFGAAVTLFLFFHLYFIANIFGGVLIFFAFLEAAFGFCVGCVVYTYFVLPFKK